jgi:hypothetical protein
MKKALGVLMILTLAAIGLIAAGTDLTVSDTADTSTYCADGNVTINWTVLSSAAADAAVVTYGVSTVYGTTYSVADGTYVTTIAAGNVADGGGWIFNGSNKSQSGTITLAMPTVTESSEYTVTVCAEQDGSGGNPNKTDCQDITFFLTPCATTSGCDQNGTVFGQVVGNKNVCKNLTPVNFNFKGDFGTPANLVITGPGGYSSGDLSVARSGDSCVYTYNWYPPAGSVAGGYTFTVTGNGHTLVDTEQLSCSSKK